MKSNNLSTPRSETIMSCPGQVDSSFPCSPSVHEYFDQDGNSREVYVHRGLIQEDEGFDPSDAFYNYLKTLCCVKYIEVDPYTKSYIVWVHEDTHLISYRTSGRGRSNTHTRISVFDLGLNTHEELQYDARNEGILPYDEKRLSNGRVYALNKNSTQPHPAHRICDNLVREAYQNHKGISSIREASSGYYGITIGPEPGDEYYYPMPAHIIMRTYIIKF